MIFQRENLLKKKRNELVIHLHRITCTCIHKFYQKMLDIHLHTITQTCIHEFSCRKFSSNITQHNLFSSDINECADPNLNDCDPNAKCYNLEGTYECRCKRGYRGDGKSCECEWPISLKTVLLSKFHQSENNTDSEI